MDAPAVLEEEKRSKSRDRCNVNHNTSVSGQQFLCHLISEAELPKPPKKKIPGKQDLIPSIPTINSMMNETLKCLRCHIKLFAFNQFKF